MTIAVALELYTAARSARDAAVQAEKEAQAAFRDAERKLVDAMLDQKTASFKDTSGRLFSVRPKFRFSATLANTPRIREWIAERGEDDTDYVREEIVNKRLKELLTKVHAEEGELGIPEFFNLDTTPGIAVRGWKGKDEDDE